MIRHLRQTGIRLAWTTQ